MSQVRSRWQHFYSSRRHITKDLKLHYVGLEIPNDFVLGYGLDYEGYGRNLTDLYKVVES